MIDKQVYAALAAPLFARFGTPDVVAISHPEADPLAQPLIDRLAADGLLPDAGAYVEWGGFMEFGHLPICHSASGTWAQVHKDGTVDIY